MIRRVLLPFVAAGLVMAGPALGQAIFTDINPDNSNHHDIDPDGATGGRVNGLAVASGDNSLMYGASEWGGIYKSIDGGLNWARMDSHLPSATWDVEIDPTNSDRVYATSFFDGKVTPGSGINVSTDGGATWTNPATAFPPNAFCANAADQDEFSAFGISINPDDPSNVFVATGCGLAISTDSGVTWSFEAPASGGRLWDVLAQGEANGGGSNVVHVCGNDGHLRSDDGGSTWVQGSGISSGTCSLAASPDEDYVLLAVVGTTIFESTNAHSGSPSWSVTRTNPSPQGRIPFVATNQRSDSGPDDVFDLWFGDVSLYRVSCTSGTASGGSPRCGTGNSPAWAGGFTRNFGAHDDTGAILFDSEVAIDACPVLMSSDGGVYYNTDTTADCHTPAWDQPDVTPHGLWPFSMAGFSRDGAVDEDLYFGNQDNGLFGTLDAGDPSPTWHNEICCDGFDTAGDSAGGLFSICCFGGGRATRVFRSDPGFTNASEIPNYPSGDALPGFKFPESFVHYGDGRYAMLTRGVTGGLFITDDIDGGPISWTGLTGTGTPPVSQLVCGVYVGLDQSDVPTFYVQTGNCNSEGFNDRLFRYAGETPGGTWTELTLPSGGFGVVAVDREDRRTLIASGLEASDGAMYRSTDRGTSWSSMPALDDLMTGGGAFPFKNSRGPTIFTDFDGYWQPSMVAFDPNSDMVIAGGVDSGIFLSPNDGVTWELISDPFTSDTSGIPHIPRPRYGHFDSEPATFYVGSQGRGIWKVEIQGIFADGFESGDTAAWSSSVP